MKPEEMKVLVVGPNVWGKGDTLNFAMANARKPKRALVYVCHPDTYVSEMGDLVYPEGFPPKEILRIGKSPAPKKKEK